MQMKWIEPSTLYRTRVWKPVLRKVVNSDTDHLARSHGELAMLDGARAADVAIDRHIVRRIREDHLRLLAVHQRGDDIAIERRATQQAVPSELPDVSGTAASRRRIRHDVVSRVARLDHGNAFDKAVDLGD